MLKDLGEKPERISYMGKESVIKLILLCFYAIIMLVMIIIEQYKLQFEYLTKQTSNFD